MKLIVLTYLLRLLSISNDFVFKKIRYNAAFANDAILTLRSQRIDTVVLSGIRTSGVIQSTAYALFECVVLSFLGDGSSPLISLNCFPLFPKKL